jgi:hypothetical protein
METGKLRGTVAVEKKGPAVAKITQKRCFRSAQRQFNEDEKSLRGKLMMIAISSR